MQSGVGYFKPQRSYGASPLGKQLAVYQNPFSLATNNPKIPDGKCSLSAGQRYQAVESFVSSTNDSMWFVLYPGLNAGLAVAGSGSDKILTYNNDTLGGSNATGTAASIGAFPGATQAIAQWRVVSQGIKLSLVNNADENDGWFEAVRLTLSSEAARWRMSLPNTPFSASSKWGQSNTLAIRPEIDYPNQSIMGVPRSAFVENATYRTGKLRDIHKHAFVLKADTNDHDFVQINGQHSSDASTLFDESNGQFLPASMHAQRLSDQLVDHSMDMVVIVVHGRVAGSPTAPQNPSQILAHLVSNHEMCYEPTTQLARFHSESYDATKSITSMPKVSYGGKVPYGRRR